MKIGPSPILCILSILVKRFDSIFEFLVFCPDQNRAAPMQECLPCAVFGTIVARRHHCDSS